MEVFGRDYELLIYTVPTNVVQNDFPSNPATIMSGLDLNTVPVEAVAVTGLQMTAEIKSSAKGQGGKGNGAIISIVNLSKVLREQVSKAETMVTLRIGYAGGVTDVYSGFVERAQHTNTKQEVITTLTCRESANVLNSVRVAKAFPVLSRYNDIFEYFAKIFRLNGVPTGKLDIDGFSAYVQGTTKEIPIEIPSGSEFKRYGFDPTILVGGYVIDGFLSQELDRFCEYTEYQWYIVRNRLYIEPANTAFQQAQGIDTTVTGGRSSVEYYQLNSRNVLGDIEPLNDTSAKSKEDETKKGTGVKFKVYANPAISVDKFLNIPSDIEDYAGDYKITDVKHTLDFRGSSWFTVIEAQRVRTVQGGSVTGF